MEPSRLRAGLLALVLFAAAVSAVRAATPVLVFHSEFGQDNATDASEDVLFAADRLYYVATTVDGAGHFGTYLLRYAQGGVQESFVGLGYLADYPVVAVAANGEAYVVGDNPFGSHPRVQRINPDGTIAWTTDLPFPGGSDLHLAVGPSSQILVLEAGRIWRLDRNSGTILWRAADAHSFTSMAVTDAMVTATATDGSSPKRNLLVKAFSMSSGGRVWERNIDFGGDEEAPSVALNPVSGGFIVSGDEAGANLVYTARFTTQGVLSWSRTEPGTGVFGSVADGTGAVTRCFTRSGRIVAQRVRDNGTNAYTAALSSPGTIEVGPGKKPLTVDQSGNALIAGVFNSNSAGAHFRITGLTPTGAQAWQFDHGDPFVRPLVSFTGIQAVPSGPNQGSFYLAYTNAQNTSEKGTLALDEFGPP